MHDGLFVDFAAPLFHLTLYKRSKQLGDVLHEHNQENDGNLVAQNRKAVNAFVGIFT